MWIELCNLIFILMREWKQCAPMYHSPSPSHKDLAGECHFSCCPLNSIPPFRQSVYHEHIVGHVRYFCRLPGESIIYVARLKNCHGRNQAICQIVDYFCTHILCELRAMFLSGWGISSSEQSEVSCEPDSRLCSAKVTLQYIGLSSRLNFTVIWNTTSQEPMIPQSSEKYLHEDEHMACQALYRI